MAEHIGLRALCSDSGHVMRRVEQGESVVVTRDGRPIADLVPHVRAEPPRRTLGELYPLFRALPPVDRRAWDAERAASDLVLGPDDIDS